MKKFILPLLAMSILTISATAADFTPGEEIMIDGSTPDVWVTPPTEIIDSEYYSVAGQDWEKGEDMVASVKLDNDEGAIVITLREDYTETKEKPLEGTIKIRDKENGDFLEIVIDCTVGYAQDTIYIDNDGDIPSMVVSPDTIYTVEAEDDGYPYGTLMFQADIADVSVRVYDEEVLFLDYNHTPDRDILLANSESDAVMEFLNFDAEPRFTSVATMTFYGYEDDTYFYSVDNGRLTRLGTDWDEDMESHEIKTNVLGDYVISDEPLRSASDGNDDDDNDNDDNNDNDAYNPDTGATDVVGIAAALATVSIIAAAAISLKKK